MSATDTLTLALKAALALRGESVVYTRGSRSAHLTAIRGRSMVQSEVANMVRLEYTDGDWIFLASNLHFPTTSGEPETTILPVKGDRIKTATETWEVLPPPDGRTYQVTQGVLMRVHSKLVNT
jgi:hypothetical protein